MTTLADQLWGVLGTLSAFTTLLAHGSTSLLGQDGGPEPSGSLDAPWGYLALGLDVPQDPGLSLLSSAAHTYAGEATLWLYDEPQAGYARLRRLALVALTAYTRAAQTLKASGAASLWRDAASGAAIYAIGPCSKALESTDPETGQLFVQVRIPYRWSVAGVAV